MLKEVAWVDVPDFSFETFDQFEKSRKKISWFVHRILKIQKWIKFVAEKKIWIDWMKWQRIFSIIEKSRNKNNFQPQEINISGWFTAKLFLIFWDKQLVWLLLLLIEAWILSISDSRVNEVLFELENKVHADHSLPWINLQEIHQRVLEEGGRSRYAWVITDDYFDRKDILLKKNWWRQFRLRERILTWNRITETLTWKRKFWKLGQEREYALSSFFEKLGSDIDIENIEKFMKILLEEEMDIHDMEALIEILRILWFYRNRSKIKLRASMELHNTKLELEHYPWIKATRTITWEMRPFVEQEASSLEEAEEARRLVWLYGDHIVLTSSWSEWAFKFDWAWDSYLKFWNWGTADSRVHLERDRIKRRALRSMYWWYFENFNT